VFGRKLNKWQRIESAGKNLLWPMFHLGITGNDDDEKRR
jgi:hypothetical protein